MLVLLLLYILVLIFLLLLPLLLLLLLLLLLFSFCYGFYGDKGRQRPREADTATKAGKQIKGPHEWRQREREADQPGGRSYCEPQQEPVWVKTFFFLETSLPCFAEHYLYAFFRCFLPMRLEGGCHRTVAWTRHELGIFLFSRTRICTNPEVNTYIHIPKNDGYGSKGPMYISLASYQDMLPCTVSPDRFFGYPLDLGSRCRRVDL